QLSFLRLRLSYASSKNAGITIQGYFCHCWEQSCSGDLVRSEFFSTVNASVKNSLPASAEMLRRFPLLDAASIAGCNIARDHAPTDQMRLPRLPVQVAIPECFATGRASAERRAVCVRWAFPLPASPGLGHYC